MFRQALRATANTSPTLSRTAPPHLSLLFPRHPHARTLLTRTALPHTRSGGSTIPIHRPQKSSPVANPHVNSIAIPAVIVGLRQFHATKRNSALPVLPFLAGFLKASVAMDIIRMAARIALTFLPVVLIRNHQLKRKLKWAEGRGDQELVDKIKTHMDVRQHRHKVIFFYVLLILPVAIFWATILASLERTPLTGRWRLILLSPEEEEEISNQLAGDGWYQAVGDILSQEGDPPQIVPPSDWRFLWVRNTLRRLESVIPLLQKEGELEAKWLSCGPEDIPFPPPADYPLKPRPRASEYVRRFAELSCGRAPAPVPHGVLGPPYSLILVDKPDSSNAFSYGFGPDGGGGIVVFSGFLDDIMSKFPMTPDQQLEQGPQEQRSWWSALFGSFLSVHPTPNANANARFMPTEQQTSELAILLAHELSHLILSHHLETLSSGSIIWPGILSIGTDIIRALIFPITMMFGPFVNDALAGIGKAGSGEFTKLTEYCTSQKQEVEADVVSARLLAHAGFDPRHAVRFWEDRAEPNERNAECTPRRASEVVAHEKETVTPMRWMGSTHPYNVVRVEKLKSELRRWELKNEEARRVHHEHALAARESDGEA